jgi:hypothetical protein
LCQITYASVSDSLTPEANVTESIPPQIPAYESQVKPPSSPFLTIMEQVVFHPSVETFSRFLPEASIYRALLWLLVLSLLGGVISAVVYPMQTQISRQICEQFFEEELPSVYQPEAPLWMIACSIPASAIWIIISVFITTGLFFVIARLLGGTGDFTETFFLYSIVFIVIGFFGFFLSIIFTTLVLIPNIGIYLILLILLLAFSLGLYSGVLTAFSLAAAHRFTFGKGCLTVLIPVLLNILCVCCFAFSLSSMFGSLISASQGGIP